jgi:hypothetical protein
MNLNTKLELTKFSFLRPKFDRFQISAAADYARSLVGSRPNLCCPHARTPAAGAMSTSLAFQVKELRGTASRAHAMPARELLGRSGAGPVCSRSHSASNVPPRQNGPRCNEPPPPRAVCARYRASFSSVDSPLCTHRSGSPKQRPPSESAE